MIILSHSRAFIACALFLAVAGCGRGKTSQTESSDSAEATTQPDADPPPPLPEFPTATCRVYTEEPGATVFIDGLPVAGGDGEPMATPCRVTAAPGSHIVTVAQEGRADRSQQIVFDDSDSQLYFEETTAGAMTSLLLAPLLHAPVGEPVALETLNSPGGEWDPFVTADGLSIWFAGDRREGRGIYVATRQSPIEQFAAPRFLEMTRGADLPASPSLTGDQKSIVYVVPDKARIWALTRPSPLGDFDERIPLFFNADAEGVRWPSAQILSDGLRIYYKRETAEESGTRVVIRESASDRFRQERIVNFPGVHPCLSADGLRQYAFDGTTLVRARRASVREGFSAPETIVELTLPGYVRSSLYRQFFVTNDEQWMFYSDDPDSGGDLYVVRLAEGHGWGVALRGEPIEQMVLAQTEPMPETTEPTETEPEPEPVDPRIQPLPYTEFRTQLVALLRGRDYEAAADFVANAEDVPDLRADSGLIAWDAEDVQRLQQFWSELTDAVSKMAPGDEFHVGSIRVEFVRFEEGRLVAKARTRELERDLKELEPLNILELSERISDASDLAHQARVATFLLYEPDIPAATRDRQIAAGGDPAAEIVEHFASRLLKQASTELARDNAGRAVPLVERIETEFPGTKAAAQAAELRNQLYAEAWRLVGSRQWQTGPDGEFTAGPERSDNALLISKEEYERFELSMEYRTNTRNGQGGVFFRYSGSGRLYNRCFKIQLTNDRGIAPDEYCTGSLFGIEAPRTNAAGDMGAWNTFRMQVDGEDFTVWINDRIVIDSDAVDDQIPESGYVALDGIEGGISYRKVLLTELLPEE